MTGRRPGPGVLTFTLGKPIGKFMSLPRNKSTHDVRPARARAGADKMRLNPGGALQFEWAETILQEEWETYRHALEAVRSSGVPFLLGGGFALAAFTGRWRDTKDIDLYVKPQDKETAIRALTEAGFEDYYSRLPYDRKWIYRNVKSGVIVDIIWSMANQRAQVDDLWFERAVEVSLRDEKLRLVPKEEFMWCKLYILQRDHCDWTDLFNLLYATKGNIDWDHLIWRLGEDLQLLQAMLTVYSWLCPREVLNLPGEVWERVGLPEPRPLKAEPSYDRIRLLDSRAWFAALKGVGEKLEV